MSFQMSADFDGHYKSRPQAGFLMPVKHSSITQQLLAHPSINVIEADNSFLFCAAT